MQQSHVRAPRAIFSFVPIAGLMAFFIGFESGGYQLALLRMAEEFGLTKAMMGALAGLQFLAMAGLPIFLGRIADRVGKKRILAIFTPVFIAGCALAVFSRTPVFFVAAVVLIGMGFAVTESLSAAVVSDIKGSDSPRAINMVQSLFSLGAVAGPLVTEFFMLRGASWRVVFLIAGIGYLILLPMLLLSRIPKIEVKEAQQEGILQVMRTPLVALMGVTIFLYVGVESGIAFFIDSFFHLEFSQTAIGAYGIAIFWLCMAFSRMAFGRVKQKPQRVVIFGFAALTFLMVAMFFVTGEVGMLLLCAVSGAVCGPLWPMIASLGMAACPRATGVVMGMICAVGSLGGAALPAMMGVFTGLWGVRVAFLLLSAAALLAAGVLFFANAKSKAVPPCVQED